MRDEPTVLEDLGIRPSRVIMWVLVIIFISMALDWFAMGNNFFLYKFFAPKQEAVRRQVYEQTKSYRQGSVQRLNTLCTQFNDADNDHKPMINSVIAQEFAEWNADDVPGYLQSCLARARR